MHFSHALLGKQQFAELKPVGKPDRIIQGKYCHVACYCIQNEAGKKQWFFAPHWIPVGRSISPESDEEQIANAISNMPDADFFISFRSFDQVQRWIAFKDVATELALCFWSEEGALFLKKQLTDGEIDEFTFNYRLSEARIYQNLWSLIKGSEAEVIKQIQCRWGFPFTSGHQLFIEIVKEVIEGEFCSCFKGRYIYNASHIKRIAILKRKDHKESISSVDTKKLYNLIDQHVKSAVWLNRLLAVAENLIEQNQLVSQCLEDYSKGIDNLSELQIKRDCAPTLKHHKILSHTWKDGQSYKGVLPWNA